MRNATRIITSTMGVIMGLGGIEHGIGEILQGNHMPPEIVIASWPGSEFFQIVAGEPAMTIVPNFLAAGILTVLFSLIFLFWAVLFIDRKQGGLVLVALSIAMLLVGGGFGPPIIGILIGAAATRINSPLIGWRAHLSTGFQNFIRAFWPYLFCACVLDWLLLFPGLSILSYYLGLNDPDIIPVLFFSALGLLLLSILAGYASDVQGQGDATRAHAMIHGLQS